MFKTAGGNLSWHVLIRGKSGISYQNHKCAFTGLDPDSVGLKHILWDSSLRKTHTHRHTLLQIQMKCDSECLFRMRKEKHNNLSIFKSS